MKALLLTILGAGCLVACARTPGQGADSTPASLTSESVNTLFSPDSAYSFIDRQVSFGPRVPGSQAHAECADWLEAKLRSYADSVIIQRATLTAFDGTPLPMRNIFAQFNPDAPDRTLLLAHWDCRPWADNDPDPAKQSLPVDGANDGASGVGVLMEIARLLKAYPSDRGIDILFVDAEDWGSDGDDESWALGTKYFAQHPPVAGYRPARAVLLDMVGGENTRFHREYFSQQYAAPLLDEVWQAAGRAGCSSIFVNQPGAAVTDDHLELIKAGIPAIDIIGSGESGGFPPTWHTADDNMSHISRATLDAVGKTIINWLDLK